MPCGVIRSMIDQLLRLISEREEAQDACFWYLGVAIARAFRRDGVLVSVKLLDRTPRSSWTAGSKHPFLQWREHREEDEPSTKARLSISSNGCLGCTIVLFDRHLSPYIKMMCLCV